MNGVRVMGEKAELFLTTFNRIEKWLQDQLNNPSSMGFSEMTRRLAKKTDTLVNEYEEDLLQLAQLRNAIVHDRISPDFVIAEPNDWAVNKILAIEAHLTSPERVTSRFAKPVTGFEENTALTKILAITASKSYSQFPIYRQGNFIGLITVQGLGFWLANQNQKGSIDLKGKVAKDILANEKRRENYAFVSADTYNFQALRIFLDNPRIEAILITEDGNSSGNLLGIIRPNDVYFLEKNEYKKEDLNK